MRQIFFAGTYRERLAGWFSSMCRFKFAVDVVDYGFASWNPAGKIYTKTYDFSHLDHHWPFHIIDLSNRMKRPESEVVMLPSFGFSSMLRILMTHVAVWLCGGWCWVFSLLHIKTCLQCVLAGFSPGRLYGNLALLKGVTKLNCVRAPFINARMNTFTITVHQAEIPYVQFTFAQNMNEFMKDRSLNAFRHNAGGRLRLSHLSSVEQNATFSLSLTVHQKWEKERTLSKIWFEHTAIWLQHVNLNNALRVYFKIN